MKLHPLLAGLMPRSNNLLSIVRQSEYTATEDLRGG